MPDFTTHVLNVLPKDVFNLIMFEIQDECSYGNEHDFESIAKDDPEALDRP